MPELRPAVVDPAEGDAITFHHPRSGQPHRVRGAVQRGRQLGRELGFPTANVNLPAGCAIPRGIYATVTRLADGRCAPGVASLGLNPTIPNAAARLEVWLFDFDEDIYGQTIETVLVQFIRTEARFESVEALRLQVMRDAEAARRIHAGRLGPIARP